MQDFKGGPYSVNFPERLAAPLVHQGILRVDPDGSVWRCQKMNSHTRKMYDIVPRRVDWPSGSNHRAFKIYLDGRAFTVGVHRLIWQLANGDIPNRLTVNHKDGNPANNVLTNFELATHSEQHLHRFKVLGHKSPGSVNKRLVHLFSAGARRAIETGDLDPLKEALKLYDEHRVSLGTMSRYREARLGNGPLEIEASRVQPVREPTARELAHAAQDEALKRWE